MLVMRKRVTMPIVFSSTFTIILLKSSWIETVFQGELFSIKFEQNRLKRRRKGREFSVDCIFLS